MAVGASTVVVCDYNHLFIDGVREASLPSMGLTLEQTIIIVDEAHNLPDRVRMGLERSITPTIVRNASFELEEMQGMLEDGGDAAGEGRGGREERGEEGGRSRKSRFLTNKFSLKVGIVFTRINIGVSEEEKFLTVKMSSIAAMFALFSIFFLF